ncbi:GTP-sensing pleiotropic transcriptional regulator CodY [Vagococcus carniphilus]|uniref:GTP-sensing pleiotropic transcriptional regulator CodY n=1 Tax=Vagococcus carniphilus TaxID=218144 RepID=UPI00288E40CD|nr:GTP-sensing pleiotropic transcriptional regulator CodY [Vagococcus carniphilus]MDT2865018.1 GTP-sensing pleiotropic transcriptional regulator CodY [Vagococcus carniphilus]
MDTLLTKTRMINELLQRENTLSLSSELPYNQMADILGDILDSNAYIINKEGIVLGYMVIHDFNNERLKNMLLEQQFPKKYIQSISYLEKTKENISIEDEMTIFPIELREESDVLEGYTTVVPIFGAGERLGTIILGRIGKSFNSNDLVLAEYGATVVGMQVLYQQSREIEKEVRDSTNVKMAISTLSYSELKAVKAIFNELDGNEGRLTASTIADKIGITRSVIVNALRKLESAGIIETRSLGMKGTYIKIINQLFKEELKKETLI